jgi:hypothetical protein
MARGGKREGAGRPKGALNKVTASVMEAAQSFTTDALSTLAEIMRNPEHPAAARVSAANALLDRGHGKPTQSVELDGSLDIEAHISEIRRTVVDPLHPDA